jgi:hypothetical protein
MKTKLHSSFAVRPRLSLLAAGCALIAISPASARDNVTISAAEFQRMVHMGSGVVAAVLA